MGPLKAMVERLEVELCEKVEDIVSLKIQNEELKQEKAEIRVVTAEMKGQFDQSSSIQTSLQKMYDAS